MYYIVWMLYPILVRVDRLLAVDQYSTDRHLM